MDKRLHPALLTACGSSDRRQYVPTTRHLCGALAGFRHIAALFGMCRAQSTIVARTVVNLARRLHDKSNGSAPTNQFADGAPGYCFTVADPKSEAHVDRIDSMGVFAKVVAKRNFSGAARELHLSQAMVSKQVRALEDWLGAQLLHRTKLHRLCRKTIN